MDAVTARAYRGCVPLRMPSRAALMTALRSQNDPHKFAGSSGKTKCAKSGRVGPKAGRNATGPP